MFSISAVWQECDDKKFVPLVPIRNAFHEHEVGLDKDLHYWLLIKIPWIETSLLAVLTSNKDFYWIPKEELFVDVSYKDYQIDWKRSKDCFIRLALNQDWAYENPEKIIWSISWEVVCELIELLMIRLEVFDIQRYKSKRPWYINLIMELPNNCCRRLSILEKDWESMSRNERFNLFFFAKEEGWWSKLFERVNWRYIRILK